MVEFVIEQDTLVVSCIQLEDKLHRLKTEQMKNNHEYNRLQEDHRAAELEFRKAKEQAADLKKKAEATAPFTTALGELFATLPNTLEQLDEAIAEAKARADVSYSTNPKVIEEYEARCKEIETLEGKLQSEQNQLNNEINRVEELKKEWLPTLQEMMEKINKSFSKYFDEIGCSGEVQLQEHEDFDKYGIAIRVKFRQSDKLHNLNAHLQSGGERSVSTMLYLIALQDLTECPFRLVDEINQGMDPYNERMIFQQVVECACHPGRPQYFLITPKLLPDLYFAPQVTVLCVFNGPWMIPQKEWAVDRFLEHASEQNK